MQRIVVLLLVVFGLAGVTACGPSAAERAAAEAKARIKAEEDAVKAKAREESLAKLEQERLAALWLYQAEAAGAGKQVTAAIFSTNNIDVDGKGARPVQLIFRDHPEWGRSSYLVMKAGDFNCYGSCSLNVTVDGAAPKKMAGRRPVTDAAIAMFINDWQSLWRMTAGAKTLTIEFPVKAGGTRTASFDIAGLDRSKMPKWDRLGAALK